MSRKAEEYRKNLVRTCLAECMRRGDNDPFGMCLRRYEKEKYHPPTETRKKLLSDLHDTADTLLLTLTNTIEQERCRNIISQTESDYRSGPKKAANRRGVELVDMFATDEKEDNNTISQEE